MKVNHRASKVVKVSPQFGERALNQALAEIAKLRAANTAAVDRAVRLTQKVEALEKQCREFHARWEAAHAKVPA